MKITAERLHDGPVLRVGKRVEWRLLLFALAYFRFQLFSCIGRNGGRFPRTCPVPRSLGVRLPPRSVVDVEFLIGLDFEALLMRIHPAALRVAEIARRGPALIVLWECWRSAIAPCAPRRSRIGAGPSDGRRPSRLPKGRDPGTEVLCG